jgi:hypothetical protein
MRFWRQESQVVFSVEVAISVWGDMFVLSRHLFVLGQLLDAGDW